MTDVSQQSRRKLLKTVATAGGVIATGKALPEKWVKPMVDSVLLPAHALVSGCGGEFCDTIETTAPIFILISVTGATVSGSVGIPDSLPLTGEGPCGAGGSFGFTVDNGQINNWLEGTISPDCTTIVGRLCADSTCGGTPSPTLLRRDNARRPSAPNGWNPSSASRLLTHTETAALPGGLVVSPCHQLHRNGSVAGPFAT